MNADEVDAHRPHKLAVECCNAAVKGYVTDAMKKLLARGDFAAVALLAGDGSLLDDTTQGTLDHQGDRTVNSNTLLLESVHAILQKPMGGAPSKAGKLVKLTVRPMPGHGKSLGDFVQAALGLMQMTSAVPCDASYLLAFEQLGTDDETAGNGYHFHSAWMRGTLTAKQISARVHSVFGRPSGWTKWDIDPVTKASLNNAGVDLAFVPVERNVPNWPKYILGWKAEPSKWPAQRVDPNWRSANQLQPFYARGGLLTAQQVADTLAQVAERLGADPAVHDLVAAVEQMEV